jgi:hypothetical protein
MPAAEPPPDELPDDLAGDLSGTAAAMREEWRADEEDLGRDAAEAWAHGRTLVDELVGRMHRGDTLAFDVAGHTFIGPVTYVGADYASVITAGGPVDVRTMTAGIPAPLVVRVVARARSGGLRPEPASPSLRARLYELEMEGAPVVVGSTLLGDEVAGDLRVAADHVAVTTSITETMVPIAWVAYVRGASD